MSETRKIPAPTDPSIDVAALVPAQRKTEVERRPWPRDPRYLAGEDGSIVGPSGRVLQPHLGKRTGRLTIKVQLIGGGERTQSAHVLVAEAWHGLRPEGLEVAHGNGVPTDNRPCNLRWATHLENEADKRAHGTLPRGAEHYKSTLTEAMVLEIRAAFVKGDEFQSQLAKRFGVTQGTISDLVRGRRWGHVETGVVNAKLPSQQRGERNPRSRMTDEMVRTIRREVAAGVSQAELGRRLGISKPAVNHVVRGRTWGHVT